MQGSLPVLQPGDEGAVRFLLEKGANQNLKTKDGRTALQVGSRLEALALRLEAISSAPFPVE